MAVLLPRVHPSPPSNEQVDEIDGIQLQGTEFLVPAAFASARSGSGADVPCYPL